MDTIVPARRPRHAEVDTGRVSFARVGLVCRAHQPMSIRHWPSPRCQVRRWRPSLDPRPPRHCRTARTCGYGRGSPLHATRHRRMGPGGRMSSNSAPPIPDELARIYTCTRLPYLQGRPRTCSRQPGPTLGTGRGGAGAAAGESRRRGRRHPAGTPPPGGYAARTQDFRPERRSRRGGRRSRRSSRLPKNALTTLACVHRRENIAIAGR